ncbi:hypothetical protein B0H21DRAFT_83076 [Amylocystis lapponica]|nr:hypothetical protein B0H21DRAFT_83076 [Amylocystis lapponica]
MHIPGIRRRRVSRAQFPHRCMPGSRANHFPTSTEVQALFDPSVSGITDVIRKQIDAAYVPVKVIFLVGGFAASPWLFAQLKQYAQAVGVDVARPDTHTNKAVADGALSFYLDHFVSVRVARVTYGAQCNTTFNPSDSEHKRRSHKVITRPWGKKSLADGFLVILEKGTRVSEEKEFRRALCIERSNVSEFKLIHSTITCYKGKFANPHWTDTEQHMFSTLCHVSADSSGVPINTCKGPKGTYYTQNFDVVLSFGLTELKAQLCWIENVRRTISL